MKDLKTYNGKIILTEERKALISKALQGRLRNQLRISIFNGVSYIKGGKNKWTSNISHEKKKYFLGYYNTEEEAAKAYDKKALELYGKNAKLNSPETKKIIKRKRDPLDSTREIITVLDTKTSDQYNITIVKKEKRDATFDLENAKTKQGKRKKTSNTNTIKSPYIGVLYDCTHILTWSSKISYNYQSFFLGRYPKDEYAAMAYDLKALELYCKNAVRNFPNLTSKEIRKKIKLIKEENVFKKNDRNSRRRQGLLRKYDYEKSSEYVGVSRRKNLWTARINYHNISYDLGKYTNEKDAALAYDKKALELYGKEARLNFPKK